LIVQNGHKRERVRKVRKAREENERERVRKVWKAREENEN
jgi:hypothetical protein